MHFSGNKFMFLGFKSQLSFCFVCFPTSLDHSKFSLFTLHVLLHITRFTAFLWNPLDTCEKAHLILSLFDATEVVPLCCMFFAQHDTAKNMPFVYNPMCSI